MLVDARGDERYRHDPYVLAREPRSVLVAPLVNQGRLLGIVYLENNLATGVFTPERLALIQVLASHAAIAIQNAQLYAGLKREVADRTRMESALRTISEGTAALTGLAFFQAVARLAAETLGTRYAFVAEVVGSERELLTTLAFWQGGRFGENVTYPVAGTPCEAVIAGETCHHPRGLQALFPADRDLATLNAESYLGVPLVGSAGDVVGHIALIHDQELHPEPQSLAVLRIFATRAGTELERQRADDALRESQLRYSTLAETVPEVLYTNRPDGACDYLSQRFLDYTGMTAEAGLGFGWTEVIHPVDRDRTVALWDESTRTGRSFEAEFRMRRADGEYRWFRTRSIPMREPGGAIVRWFGVATDVDDSKRAEEALRAALTEVAQLRDRLQAENIYLLEEVKQHQEFEEIIGRSPVLQRALRQVEQVAPTDTTVLILGETGTGKELVARAIHNLSARRDRPMVTVNCGAISAGLVESELFGHEKGAFTGAVSRKVGRFELAGGGTIFLDEIGDLPLDLQVKLLRVLQEGEFERVGGSATIKVDVRVIAATHRDLRGAVESGRFRADLFYRLNVFPIRTAAAAGSAGGHSRAGALLRDEVHRQDRQAHRHGAEVGPGQSGRLPLAGERAGAGQRAGAIGHHQPGQQPRAGRVGGRAGRVRCRRHRHRDSRSLSRADHRSPGADRVAGQRSPRRCPCARSQAHHSRGPDEAAGHHAPEHDLPIIVNFPSHWE